MIVVMKRIIPLLVSLIGFGLGYMLTNSVDYNFCLQNDYQCRELLNRIGDSLFYGAGALSIVFFILLFVPSAFNAWKKFAIWFIPIMVFLFVFYPTYPSPGDYFSPYGIQIIRWVSILYVFLSIGVITYAKFKKH